MNKSDLRNGHIIETRKGETGLIIKDNVFGEDAVIFSENNWTGLDGFDENLYWYGSPRDNKFLYNRNDFCRTVDIMRVYKPNLPTGFLSRANGKNNDKPMTLIWEREDEYIEIEGRKYNKSDVIERIKELKPI